MRKKKIIFLVKEILKIIIIGTIKIEIALN